MIIGAARGKKAAMTLVQNIITDMYKKTGGFDIQNVNQIEIEGEAYRLNNSRSSIFFEPKNINIVTASQDKEIPLTNTYTDSSFNSVFYYF